MIESYDDIVDEISRYLTGIVNAGCCARTGGMGKRDDGLCDCREAACDILEMLERRRSQVGAEERSIEAHRFWMLVANNYADSLRSRWLKAAERALDGDLIALKYLVRRAKSPIRIVGSDGDG